MMSRDVDLFVNRVCFPLYCYLFELIVLSIFVFFFFQAEDGIRDLTVTGVQTCALPISATHREFLCARRALAGAGGENFGQRLEADLASKNIFPVLRMSRRNQWIAFAALVVILGAVVYLNRRQAGGPGSAFSASDTAAILAVDNPQIRTDKIARIRAAKYSGTRRNI